MPHYALSVGKLPEAAWLAPWLQRRARFGPTIIGTSWILALLYPLLAIAPSPLVLGLIRTGISGTVSISNTIRLSYPLARIPDELQGRVNSLTTLLAYGSLPVGQALTGLLLQDVGPTRTILTISVGILVSAIVATANPQIRHAP